MSYGKHIKQHPLAFKGRPVRMAAAKEPVIRGLTDQRKRRAMIAKELKDRIMDSDSQIAKRLNVPKSSVYVVRVKAGADGKYSHGRVRTPEEFAAIMKEGGLEP